LVLQGHGIYQCYCKQYSSYSSILDPTDFCFSYQYDMNVGSIQKTLISVLISTINIVIALVNQMLIERIGYHYRSQVIKSVVVFIFSSQFVNTGILLILMNANF
jgi:hypothetical protein